MNNKDITVIKRDESQESFEPEKVRRIAIAAGLADDEANALAGTVASQVKDVAKNNDGKIASTEIRTFVYDEMSRIDEYAAGLFGWFEKNKEN